MLLIARRANEVWKIAYPGMPEFNQWLWELPDKYYSSDIKEFFTVSPMPLADSSGIYKLPYPSGESAYVSCIGCRTGHAPAIDFLLSGQNIVAATSGTIEEIVENNTECCCDYNCYHCNNKIVLLHDNGERSYYKHIGYNSVPDNLHVGDTVARGQIIAQESDVGYIGL